MAVTVVHKSVEIGSTTEYYYEFTDDLGHVTYGNECGGCGGRYRTLDICEAMRAACPACHAQCNPHTLVL